MLQHAFVAFVLAGVSYAAYLDLRTSEVPDWVSLTVAAGSLLYYGYQSAVAGTAAPLLASLISGTVLFALGWTMYLAGMWGGADAFVLGAVGYALPSLPAGYGGAAAPWPFPFSLLMTVFTVGAVYSVVYAAVVAARADGFRQKLGSELQ
ncbi:MAG: A24 family peptidase, partial [Candidatus Nanohaloarchaea archaeon]|nr:A24 family peptidase [Candidatus Nanohaloarchaea archaeon]